LEEPRARAAEVHGAPRCPRCLVVTASAGRQREYNRADTSHPAHRLPLRSGLT
jgi:hypothetical protein